MVVDLNPVAIIWVSIKYYTRRWIICKPLWDETIVWCRRISNTFLYLIRSCRSLKTSVIISFREKFTHQKNWIVLQPIWRKILSPLRILYLFIKSSVNPFVDISLAFFAKSSSFMINSIRLALFEVTYLLIFFSFSLKYVSFTKSTISFAKSACFNLAATWTAVKLLNSCVVIYLPSSQSNIFFSISLNFVL